MTMRDLRTSWHGLLLLFLPLFVGILSLLITPTEAVSYIQSDIFGNMIMARGKKLASNSIYKRLPNLPISCCRNACFAHVICKAFSVVPMDGTHECQLSDKRPQESNLEDDNEAVYIFWQSSLNGRLNRLMDDGHLYFVSNGKANFTEALNICSRIPGYRLGIFTTEIQQKTLVSISQEIGEELYIDLNDLDSRKWGDETPLQIYNRNDGLTIGGDTTNNEPVYRIKTDLALRDTVKSSTHLYICQANVLG